MMCAVRWSLRSHLLALVLVAVVPGMGIMVYAAAVQRGFMASEAHEDVGAVANLVAERNQRAVDAAKGLLVGLSLVPSLAQRDTAGCVATVRPLLARLPIYANAGAVDPSGEMFCSAAPRTRQVNLSDRPWVRETLATGEFAVGGLQVSRVLGAEVLAFGYPVSGAAGELRAVAFASLDLRGLQRDLDALPVPAEAQVVVLDRGGLVLAARPGGDAWRGRPFPAAVVEAAVSSQEAARMVGPDGVERVHAARDVKGARGETAMRVVAGLPTSAAYARMNRVFARTLLAFGAVSLLALVLAGVTGERLLVRRLRALMQAAGRIAGGDLSARSGFSAGPEELGQLARAFDEMAGSLEAVTHQNRLILDSAGEGIFGVDRQRRLTFVNPAACRMLGRASGEMLGLVAHDLFHRQRDGERPHRTEDCPFLATLAAGVENRVSDDVFMCQDGTAMAVEYVAAPLLDRGAIAGAVVTFRDVGERRRLEEQLRHAQKMEAVGQLAGGVAHDFNNHLTAIMSFAGFARGALPEGHAARADLAELQQAAERAAQLTRQLLAFSRRQVLQPRVIDLGEVVLGLENMLRRVLGEQVALSVQVSPGAGCVRADAGQLEQVIINLCVNARDAMPGGGKLAIAVTPAPDPDDRARRPDPHERGDGWGEASGSTPGARGGRRPAPAEPSRPPVDSSTGLASQLERPLVMLSVSDTGVGMDAETQSHAFEPFFTTKPIGTGTGLGLSTVYGIVTQSGGTVRVSSAPGRGSEFRVYLPRVEGRAEARDRDVRPGPVRGSETVLLVEDDDAVRALVRRTLAGAGYRVLEAGRPSEALDSASRHTGHVHLLLTDVMLPESNGFALSRQLAVLRPGLRVLYVSGQAGGHLEAAGLGTGEGAFLAKPFTPEALLRSVRDVLDAPRPHAGAAAPA
jgi:PAS domain S-box-containing protein